MLFANFKGILGFSVQSIILAHLLGNTWYLLERVHKVMVFNLRLVDFDLFVLFLCLKVRCLWSSHFRPLSTSLLQRLIFLTFLILVTCKNKAMSASFHRQKFHSPSWFPSPSSQFCFCWPYWWSRKTQNPFEVCKMCSAIQQIWQ